MDIIAPAKINLYLKVIRKRNDGYHEIETLFERISLFDRLSITLSATNTVIDCGDSLVPTDKNSLLGRTVELFRKKTGEKAHFKVDLEKNIPISAGLGGGSSDAAALLKGMNQITGNPLDKKRLIETARELGADISFFVEDCSFGLGKGRGDIVEKIETDIKLAHIIINPPFGVSTRGVYSKMPPFGLTKNRGIDRISCTFLHENNYEKAAKNLHNDLQAIVLGDFPVLNRVFDELTAKGAKGSLLSGSGPTVFGIFDKNDLPEAEKQLKRTFPEEENWRIYIAETY